MTGGTVSPDDPAERKRTAPPRAPGAAATAAVLGLDIGGSKTHGVRSEDGRVVREALAGSANIASVGVEEAGRAMDQVLDELGRDGVAAACVGAAGADSPEARQRLAKLVGERLPTAEIAVVHDARLILAAAGLDQGVVVISGTGSVGWGLRGDGVEARAGGWGYLLGDEGSGYGLVRDAVRHSLGAADRGLPASPVTLQLIAECGLDRPSQLLDHFYARPERRYWAQRAGGIFLLAASGDPDAERLIARAADALAELAGAVAARLRLPGPAVLGGGLVVNQPALQTLVRARLAERGINDVRILQGDPVLGAVRLAQDLLATGGTT